VRNSWSSFFQRVHAVPVNRVTALKAAQSTDANRCKSTTDVVDWTTTGVVDWSGVCLLAACRRSNCTLTHSIWMAVSCAAGTIGSCLSSSSSSVRVCNVAGGRRSGGRHCTAGQYSYIPLGRHLVNDVKMYVCGDLHAKCAWLFL